MVSKVIRFILMLLVCFVVGVYISRNSFSRVVVSGHSMDYTLHDGQTLWVENLPWGSYSNNQIVVLKENGKRLVKRVVGSPGDRLYFKGDTLYRNGKPLKEDYVTDDNYNKGLLKEEVVLGENEYFLLGDNRDVSNDSRYFGAVSGSSLQGRVLGYE